MQLVVCLINMFECQKLRGVAFETERLGMFRDNMMLDEGMAYRRCHRVFGYHRQGGLYIIFVIALRRISPF